MTGQDEFAGFAPADEFGDFAAATPQQLAPTEQKPEFDPTEGMSTGERFNAGVGKGIVDTGHGIYQLAASLGHAAGLVSDDKMAQIQRDVDERRKYDEPLMNTGAGHVGDIAGEALPALAIGPEGIMASAATGAATGAIQPVGSGDSRLRNAGAGALGGAGGAAVGKVLSGVAGGFGGSAGRQSAVDILKSEGIPLSVAQRTGSKVAQTVERASGITSDAPAEFAQQQGEALNRSFLRSIGVNDPEVTAATSDVLAPAKKKITNVMDDVASRGVKVDDEMLTGMGDVEDNARRMLPESDMGPIRSHINDILSNAAKNDGTLDGTAYQKIRTSLGGLAKDPRYAPLVHDLQDVVDDSLARSSPEDAARLATARQQYRSLKQIEPAVDSSGNISVPKLMNSLMNKSNRNQSLYGAGDQRLVSLAKAARQIIPDTLGNSGTAERSLPLLTAAETLASGEPLKAMFKLGAGTLGLNAAGRAMRSQGYLGNSLTHGFLGAPGRIAAPFASETAPAVGIGALGTEPKDKDQTEEIARASGGKVDKEALVARLIKKWKSTKKVTDETTKQLLHVPDAAIVKALDIAQKSI